MERRHEDLITDAIRADDLRRLEVLVKKHPGAIEDMTADGFCCGSTPMHEATRHGASLEVVQLIVRNLPVGFYFYGFCEDLTTPFHVAGEHVGLDVIRYLDKRNPDMMSTLNEKGNTCIHTAVKGGLPLNVIKYLYKRQRPNGLYHEWRGTNPLHFVGDMTPPAVVQFLADASERFAEDERSANGGDMGWMPPLHAVLDNGAGLEAVRIVHEAFPRAIVRLSNDDGRLPLHHAVARSAPDVVRFLLSRYRDAARVADTAASDLPLHLAAGRRAVSPLAVRLLVRAWPQAIHEKNSKGLTPLQLAQAAGVRDPAVLDLLARGLPK